MNDHQQTRPQRPGRSSLLLPLGTVVVTAACAAAAWYGLLGWDNTYQTQPDGRVTGPYEAWQVIGLVVLLIAVGIGAGWRGHPIAGTLGTTIGLTVAVYIDWSSVDETGLFVVGVAMVFIGTLAAGFAVTSISAAIRKGRAAARQSRET